MARIKPRIEKRLDFRNWFRHSMSNFPTRHKMFSVINSQNKIFENDSRLQNQKQKKIKICWIQFTSSSPPLLFPFTPPSPTFAPSLLGKSVLLRSPLLDRSPALDSCSGMVHKYASAARKSREEKKKKKKKPPLTRQGRTDGRTDRASNWISLGVWIT